MYAMLCTRADIYFAIGLVSRYQSNPGLAHWQAVKRIFHYLRGTSDLVLCYQNGDLRLTGYTDVDWGGNLDESRSTSGYVFTLVGGAISWCSKKQDCIALSTMEVEYIACCLATQEVIWLRSFLQDLRLTPKLDDSVQLMCDNTLPFSLQKIKSFIGKQSTLKGTIILYETPSRKKKLPLSIYLLVKCLQTLLLNLFLETLSKLM